MKKLDFYITGLPRSKTAWFANYFTFGESFCFHEMLSYDYVIPKGFSKIGNSGCDCLIYQDELIQHNPQAKWVFVNRDPLEVRSSLIKATRVNSDAITRSNQVFLDKLSSLRSKAEVFDIPFNFNEEKIIELHRYLSLDYFPDRYYILRDLKVEISREKMSALMKENGLT